jgi:hypothetical protein
LRGNILSDFLTFSWSTRRAITISMPKRTTTPSEVAGIGATEGGGVVVVGGGVSVGVGVPVIVKLPLVIMRGKMGPLAFENA